MNQGQNLINPVMVSLPSLVEGRRPGFYKSITLDVVSILAAFAVGYSYREYLAGIMSPWVVFAAFLVFGAASAFQALLCKEAGRRAFIIACEVAALSMFFYVVDWRFLCAAAACAFVLFFWGYLSSRVETDHGMDIRLFKSTKSVVGKIMTGTVIFLIVVYIPLWQPNGIFVSQTNFNYFFEWASGALSTLYPNIQISGSFGDFANNIASAQLKGVPAFESMNSKNQAAALAQGASGIIDNLSKNLQMKVQPSDSVGAITYQFITKMLTEWKDQFQGLFFAGWGIVVFLVVRSVGIIIVWIDQLLILVFYEILFAFRLIRVKGEPRTKEVLEF